MTKQISKVGVTKRSKRVGGLRALIALIVLAPNQAFATNLLQDRFTATWSRLEQASLSVCEQISFGDKVASCVGSANLEPSSGYAAWTWNGAIHVSAGLLGRSNDDELAFALAHEMSHNIFRHHGGSRKNELEADYWAARIMLRAGYDPRYARNVLRHGEIPRLLDFPFSLFTYPSMSRRMSEIVLATKDETSLQQSTLAIR